jgi:predicted secreted hydrolase
MMRKDLLLIALLGLILVGWLGMKTRAPTPETGTMTLANLLGQAPEHFRRVTGPLPLAFPRDHAAHPDYRNEWWYFTGNLDGPDGQRFGFQFTLFRFGLGQVSGHESAWSASDLWMAHLALSEIDADRFFQSERFARGALGLAGATEQRWWLRDWQVDRLEQGWRLRAPTDEFELDLTLQPTRPIVLQGDRGYSRKGPEPGNASRYYSATRLATSGRVRVGDRWTGVEGLAWLDREWGSGQLSDSVAGWDWFALHLNDGRDLMVYRLRHPDGSTAEWSAGLLVDSDGRSTLLGARDFNATPLRRWRDPEGVSWPVAWSLTVPDADLTLTVRPAFDAQMWTRSVRYWEGSVEVIAADSGQPLGRGYLELSGYGEDQASNRRPGSQ